MNKVWKYHKNKLRSPLHVTPHRATGGINEASDLKHTVQRSTEIHENDALFGNCNASISKLRKYRRAVHPSGQFKVFSPRFQSAKGQFDLLTYNAPFSNVLKLTRTMCCSVYV